MGYYVDPRRLLDLPNNFFLKNVFLGGRFFVSTISKLQAMSHAQIALHVHHMVQACRQPSYVRAQLEFWEEIAEKQLRVGPMPTDGGDIDTNGMVSAWTTYRYDLLNLRGALKDKERAVPDGTGDAIWTQPWAVLPAGITLKPQMIILKSGDKGYWLRVNNTLESWTGFE